ncbi:MAG TPA: hypothetical protein VF576_06080, partial [Rubricoccaceae bacterium]
TGAPSAEHRDGGPYEYTRLGAWAYADFMDGLRASADDVRADWAQGPRADRPLRLFTFAAGIAPYSLPGAYVFEPLVSHRRGCDYPYHLGLSADYVHVMTPGHGTVAAQLPRATGGRYRLVSDVPLWFNGRRERVMVFRNLSPGPNPLPPRVHDACPAGVDA